MLTYPLAQKTSQPLYVYFYECIKQDILSGSLCPYEKLPSKRAFAKHHQVSLITVEAAYQQLIAEGYVRSEERKGYYVNAVNAVSVIDPPHPCMIHRNMVLDMVMNMMEYKVLIMILTKRNNMN